VTPAQTAPPANPGAPGNGAGTSDTIIESYYANYTEYSKTFRTWLVAYGIGGPALLLTNAAAKTFAASAHARCIVILFLVGVALQVLGTGINKWAAWHVYSDMTDASRANGWWSKAWCRVNKQAWIDVWVDVGAIVAFGIATWMLLGVFLVEKPPGV
jgi:hypothetical protein